MVLTLTLSALSFLGIASNCDAPTDTTSIIGGDIRQAEVRGISVKSSSEVTTIDHNRLDAVNDVASALREVAGVQVRDYGGVGGMKTINVRSLGSEYTSVFIDGIQVTNAQNMQVDLGRFSISNVDHITVTKSGKHSPLLSAREYSSSSSIHISSLIPIFKQGRRLSFSAGLKAGSSSTFVPSLSIALKTGRNGYLAWNAEYVSSTGRYRYKVPGFDTTLVRQNGDISAFRSEIRAGGMGANDQWRASLYYYDSERGLPGPVVRTATSLPGYGDRQSDTDMFLQGVWKHYYSSGAALQLKGKFSVNRTRFRTDPLLNPQSYPADVNYRQTSGYISLSHNFALMRGWTADVAADIQYERLNGNPIHFAKPERLTAWSAINSRYEKGASTISASVVYTMASDWFDNTDAGAYSRDAKVRNMISSSASYHLNKGQFSLESAFGRTVRMPSFNDLYYTLVGNSDLREEKALTGSLGVGYRLYTGQRIEIVPKASVYGNVVKNKIVAIPTFSQFRWTMFNIGKVCTGGADAEIAANLLSNNQEMFAGSLTMRYSFQRSADLTNPDSPSYKGQIPYIPRHSGTVSAWMSKNGWRADMTACLTGERWSSSANYSDYRIAPWWICDLTLSKTFSGLDSLLDGDVRISMTVRNIFNKTYQIILGYPMPGANCLASVSYSFK